MLHALDFYKDKGADIDRLVLLQPTSPLRCPEDIAGCLELYVPSLDMVVSVKEAATNPYTPTGCAKGVGIQRSRVRHKSGVSQSQAHGPV